MQFFVSDFGADLPQDPEPLALGLFRPYMWGGQGRLPKGKKIVPKKNSHFAKQKCNFFWCMTLGLTFFKPGAPGLGPFYTLHVGWPGPTAKREKRLLPQKNSHFAKQKCIFFGERLAGPP